MAETDGGGIEIYIDVDTRKVLDAQKFVKRSSTQMASDFDKIDNAIKELISTQVSLGSTIDKTGRVIDRFGKENQDATRALELLRKKQAQIAQQAGQVNQIYSQQTKAAKGVRGAIGGVRGAFGQLGFQVQDVAVQLQSGQNALLVLGQQGSQVASIFGPGGAVIGAILAVGAAIATSLIPSLEEAEGKLDDLPKDLAERLNRIKEQLGDTDKISLGSAVAVEVQKVNNEYDKLQNNIDALNNRIAQVQENIKNNVTEPLAGLAEIDRIQGRIADKQARQAELAKLINRITQEGLDAQLSGAEGVSEELTKQEKLTQELNQKLAVSKARLEGGELAALRLATAFQLGLTNAEQLPAEIDQLLKKIVQSETALKTLKEQQKPEGLVTDELGGTSLSQNIVDQLDALNQRNAKLRELEAEAVKVTQEANQKRIASYATVASGIATATQAIGQALADSQGEQSSAAKAAFALSKAFSIAQASLNLSLALSQALADPSALTLPQKLANYAAIASAGASLVQNITSTSFGSGRLYGGNVAPGKLYPVTEDGRPEVLTQGNKQYLLPGSRGNVTSNRDMGGMMGGATVNIDIVNNAAGMVSVTPSSSERDGQTDIKFIIDAVRNDVLEGGSVYSAIKERTNAGTKTG